MATMSIRIADDDKIRADKLFKALGLNTNAAINMFIKQCIRTQGIPFTPKLVPTDDLQEALEESEEIAKQYKLGTRKGYRNAKEMLRSITDD